MHVSIRKYGQSAVICLPVLHACVPVKSVYKNLENLESCHTYPSRKTERKGKETKEKERKIIGEGEEIKG